MANGDDSDPISESVELSHLPDVTPKALPVDPSQTPQTTQTPSQQKEVNQDLTKDTHPDPILEERMKIYEDDDRRYKEAQQRYDQINSEIMRINEELRTTQVPQPPQLRPTPQYPGLMGGQQGTSPTTDQQAKRGDLGTIMMQAATLIAIGSAVFQRHRNPYAQIVQQSALGGFFQGLNQANKDKAAEQLQNWNKAVELTDKLNKEDTQTYHDVLANRRLNISDQHLLISDISAQRGDVRMYAAASRKDLDEVMKILADKAKARTAWVKGQLDLNTRAVNKWLESTQGLAWSQDVKKKFGIDPYKNHDALLQAFEKYPISKWQADRKGAGTVDTEETEDKIPAASGGSGRSKADPVVLQGSSDEELNRQFEQLPQGAFYTGPDGVTRQK